MSTGKILLGILAGATVGAALGVLFAPEKGVVSREKISKKGDDVWDSLKCMIEDLYEKGKEKVKETAK